MFFSVSHSLHVMYYKQHSSYLKAGNLTQHFSEAHSVVCSWRLHCEIFCGDWKVVRSLGDGRLTTVLVSVTNPWKKLRGCGSESQGIERTVFAGLLSWCSLCLLALDVDVHWKAGDSSLSKRCHGWTRTCRPWGDKCIMESSWPPAWPACTGWQ